MNAVATAAGICRCWGLDFLALHLEVYPGIPPHLLRNAANDEPTGPEAA